MTEKTKRAYLYSACPPDERQKDGFSAFIKRTYGEEYEIVWEKTDEKGGFRLRVDGDEYDWTVAERMRQLKKALLCLKAEEKNVIPLLKKSVAEWKISVVPHETGTVLSVGDGIAVVSGLSNASYGEILLFDGDVKGMVQSLERDFVGCILFDNDDSVSEGATVFRTGKTAGVPVGEAFLGRVVNALGEPIDGGGEIDADGYFPIERSAPDIIDRQPVNKPLQTGLLVIDSMFPIGRGQRELIIGDRQTGKTAIAVDTIINQKGKDVVCIYVAIGQKTSSVVRLHETFKKLGAADYTVIFAATAGEAAPMQYIVPYAGCALAEYFMEKGKDVLIVYDDLSKHAIAYRSLSLLLNRSPGREAYPGDVFYLHSRLLERSAHVSEKRGGGSITALPVVETQAGDVSAYIPTNIISITDGQIYLESDLFFAGQRPAVNVGLSVSRVGGDAQTKAMKKVAGTLRLDLAQYREMEVFTQFAGDLDEITARQLAYGKGLMIMLRQEKYSPYPIEDQVVLLTLMTSGLFVCVDPNKIKKAALGALDCLKKDEPDLLRRVSQSGVLTDEDKQTVLDRGKFFMESLQ